MFYKEKASIAPATSLELSAFNMELKGLLMKAGEQLDRKGPAAIRSLVKKIVFRK